MPHVGKKVFPYDAQGVKDAKAEAEKTGKPLKVDKSKAKKRRRN